MPLEILRNDLTKMKVDAIVNPTNQHMYGTAGVDGSIHKGAGPELQVETGALAPLKPGQVTLTKAYRLPSNYIIHTVGPIWHGGLDGESDILASCYFKGLELAASKGFNSIAFPLIASGAYGFPKDLALTIAVNTIGQFLMQSEMMVYLVVFDQKSFQLSEKLFTSVKSYIDDHYIEEIQSSRSSDYLMESMVFEDKAVVSPKKRKLEDLMSQVDESFATMLLRLIDERALKDPVVYKGANVTKQTFSKIRNNKDYRPKKNTAIAFAISLKLSMDETKDLLQKAGYALTNSSQSDLIISYFIDEGIYEIYMINTTLFEFGFSPLGM